MAAAEFELALVQNETYARTFEAQGDSPTFFSNVVGACLQIRRSYRQSAVLAEWDLGDEITIDEVGQKLTIDVDNEATDALPAGELAYDLFLRYADGRNVQMLYGVANVRPKVTDCTTV